MLGLPISLPHLWALSRSLLPPSPLPSTFLQLRGSGLQGWELLLLGQCQDHVAAAEPSLSSAHFPVLQVLLTQTLLSCILSCAFSCQEMGKIPVPSVCIKYT